MKIVTPQQRLEREAKLPKWARDELGRLRRDLEHERERLAQGPEDSDTFADPYSDTPRPLGRKAHIEFRFAEREGVQCYIDHDHNGKPFLYVYGTGIYLAVEPSSANTLRIRSADR